MSLLLTFLELDKLYESASTKESYNRQALISKLKELGKYYNFDKYSDEQLAQILLKANVEKRSQDDFRDTTWNTQKKPVCDECGCTLTDGGFCPSCDDGVDLDNELWESLVSEANELSTEHAVVSIVDKIKAVYEAGLFSKLPVGRANAFMVEIEGVDKERLTSYFKRQPEFAYEMHNASGIISHEFISNEYDVEIFDSFISMYKIPQNESFNEGIFNDIPSRSSWIAAPAPSVTVSSAQKSQTSPVARSSTKIVTIVHDFSKHKLRAQADDGVHGKGWVAFPAALRNTAGQQYEVENLVWNGKNYRASGKITPVSNSVVVNTQNINENIIKENYEMNFQTILEELDRLYDEDLNTAEAEETEVAEACTKPLTEDDDEEVLVDDEPIIEDETPTDAQLVLECSKCGALVIKAEAEVDTDNETGVANTSDACQYCEAEEGYKVIGTFTPYDTEAEEEVLESLTEGKLIDNIKKVATRVGADAATIVRSFAELGDIITNRDSKFYDFAEYVENKAVLKALMSGNEKVMNTLTKEDIEDLKQDVAAYEKAKADKKAGKAPEDEEDLEEFLDADINLNLDGGTGNDVSVLGNGKKGLSEFLDADIDLSLDGGEGNDVAVLGRGNADVDLDEGIFDKNKKNSANYKNQLRDFNGSVELVTKGKSLSDIAIEAAQLLMETISEFRWHYDKTGKAVQSKKLSKSGDFYDVKKKQILAIYTDLIKGLKNPANFSGPTLRIKDAAKKILGDYAAQSSKLSKLEQYDEMMLNVSKIEADSKLKRDVLADYYKATVYALKSDLQMLKGRSVSEFFG